MTAVIDTVDTNVDTTPTASAAPQVTFESLGVPSKLVKVMDCLLYTSDAADE